MAILKQSIYMYFAIQNVTRIVKFRFAFNSRVTEIFYMSMIRFHLDIQVNIFIIELLYYCHVGLFLFDALLLIISNSMWE